MIKGTNHTPESIAKMRIVKSGENNPNYGVPRIFSKEVKEKISKTIHEKLPLYQHKLKEAWADPAKREKRLETMHTPEYKEKISETVKWRWKNSPEYRNRMSGENNPGWNGGSSFEPYCPKFNEEFKNRVRAFFNYQCAECGSPQNGKKLAVHHVNFNKQTCCDGSIPMFIPLCQACHAKTSPTKKREYWNKHFTEIIENYYSGKCYFTKEEFAELENVI